MVTDELKYIIRNKLPPKSRRHTNNATCPATETRIPYIIKALHKKSMENIFQMLRDLSTSDPGPVASPTPRALSLTRIYDRCRPSFATFNERLLIRSKLSTRYSAGGEGPAIQRPKSLPSTPASEKIPSLTATLVLVLERRPAGRTPVSYQAPPAICKAMACQVAVRKGFTSGERFVVHGVQKV